jgi:hypothetical protein
MTNKCRIITAKSIGEIAKFSELHIYKRTMVIYWFYGKIIAIVFLWTVKTMFLLFYLTDNINLVPHMDTLFLLVLPHRKLKPCFSLVCAKENGNPVSSCLAPQKMETLVSPCFASQKMETLFHLAFAHRKWKPRFSLFCLSEKQQISLFLKVSFDFSSST